MATISKRPGQPKPYLARYRGPDRREVSKAFARKVDAQRWLDTQAVDVLRGEWVDPRSGSISFEEWASHVLDSRRSVKESTRVRDESVVRNLVLPHFGKLSLAKLTPEHFDRWITDLTADGLAPATIGKAYQLASMILDQAVRRRRLNRSPAQLRSVELPKAARKEMRTLQPAQVEALTAAVAPRFRVLILTAAYTGARWGELVALDRFALDVNGRALTVSRSLSDVRGELSFTTPKTDASRRRISLPSFLVAELVEHVGRYSAGDGLLFTSTEGLALRRTNWRRRHWVPVVRSTVGEPMRFHDLRHTHAAMLIAQGAHPKVIQSRLGHAKIATTLDTYGHLWDGLDEAAADTLDDLISGLRTTGSGAPNLASVNPKR